MRSEEFVVPGIRELVEITGLTYAAANARLWKYRRGCIDRRGLLETRAQAMRSKAANLWGIPDGGNAEKVKEPHDRYLEERVHQDRYAEREEA